jgi:hypothetical protein
MYSFMAQARQEIKGAEGVIVAADSQYEQFLPWWWKHYRAHSSLPVTFFDLGLTKSKKNWCASKGTVIPLSKRMDFLATRDEVAPEKRDYWEKHWTPDVWKKRAAWFAKPFILLQSPYKKTLFLDIDCRVQADIAPLFNFLTPLAGFTIVKHEFQEGVYHNSGVCAALQGSPVVLKWAQEGIEKNHEFMGDEDIIHYLILQNHFDIPFFPLKYNHPHLFGGGSQAVIQHFLGLEGKDKILLDL